MFPAAFYPTAFYPGAFYPGAGKNVVPSLTLTDTSSTVADGGTPVGLTATLSGVTGSISLTASLAGLGSISTTTPTSGVEFFYTPPASGSGVAIVTVSGSSLLATANISYGPASGFQFRDVLNAPSAGLNLVAQLTDDNGASLGSPLTGTMVDRGNTLYSFTVTLPIGTAGYINYYVSGSPSTPIWSSEVSPLRDSPGVTTTVAAIAGAQNVGTIVTVNTATSIVVSSITIPIANLAGLGCVLNDGITAAFKGGVLISSASVTGSNVTLVLASPGLPTVAVGDAVEIRF